MTGGNLSVVSLKSIGFWRPGSGPDSRSEEPGVLGEHVGEERRGSRPEAGLPKGRALSPFGGLGAFAPVPNGGHWPPGPCIFAKFSLHTAESMREKFGFDSAQNRPAKSQWISGTLHWRTSFFLVGIHGFGS